MVRLWAMTQLAPTVDAALCSAAVPVADTSGWRAELDLGFAVRSGKTVLATRRHVGPLVVQRPFYPEDGVCHVYLLHPPGGIVGGDTLLCRIGLEAGAHAVLTTPAATKFYRSSGLVAEQRQEIRIDQATCEWLPQESIYFASARARVGTRVELDADSRFIGWDIACFGRPACEEVFEQGEVYQSFELWREGVPLFLDRLHVEGADVRMMQAPWGLGGGAVLGTLLAFPASVEDLDVARAVVEQLETEGEALTGVSLVDGVLVARSVAPRAGQIRALFIAIWQGLRPRVLQRPAVAPRVWAT